MKAFAEFDDDDLDMDNDSNDDESEVSDFDDDLDPDKIEVPGNLINLCIINLSRYNYHEENCFLDILVCLKI